MENEKVAQKVSVALHPPKCPQCGVELDYLDYFAYAHVKSQLEINEEGNAEWGYMELLDGTWPGSIEYQCPACGIVMFQSDDSAIKYLKGEYEGPWGEEWWKHKDAPVLEVICRSHNYETNTTS